MLRTWWLARLLLFALALSVTAGPHVIARQPGGLMEGYVSSPVVLPPDPDIAFYDRPTFAPIQWPVIPDRFCSAAEKEAFLARLDLLLGVANANAELAGMHADWFSRRLAYAERRNAAVDGVARLRLEAEQLGLIRSYHSKVLDVWTGIRDRLAALPVTDCGPQVETPEPSGIPPPPSSLSMEGYFVDPIIAAPINPAVAFGVRARPSFARINFPAVATTFCSQAQKDAYLAEVVATIRVALLNAQLARSYEAVLINAYSVVTDPTNNALYKAELDQFQPIVAHHEAVLKKWQEIEARMKALPVVDCRPPADASPPAPTPPRGIYPPDFDPYGLPRLPERFCSEEERYAFLLQIHNPFVAQATAESAEANRRLAEISDMLQHARRLNARGPAIDQLRKEYDEISHRAAYLDARARAAVALRAKIFAIPVVPCDGPADGKVRPASPQPGDSPPPVGARSFPPPSLPEVDMIDLPNRFCSESERMAFLNDVYHPAAKRASRNAVLAATHLAELSRIIAEGPNARYSEADIEAARLAHAMYAPVAAFHRERALRFINLRRAILLIPVVNCEPLDADSPPPQPRPPSPVAPPAPPQTASSVRPLTDLEAGVIAELNLLRADPAAYANLLSGAVPGARRADVEAAAAALRAASPAPPLEADPRLSGAAIRHADDIGPAGLMSHTGTDGSTLGARIRAQGLIASLTAEELSYGQSSPRAVVAQLVIDAGVAGAPHRRDLLNPVFRRVGVGCGPHRQHRKVCVITLSGPPVGS